MVTETQTNILNMVLHVHVSVCFVICLMVSWTDAFTESCDASLLTIKNVTECPTDKESYEKAANMKNCSSISESCQKRVQYHCVLNSDLNGLVEVCATSINVFGGVCPKFDENLKSIIRVYSLECQNFSSWCPISYNSTETYKYPRCFDVRFTTVSTVTSTSEENLGSTKNSVISAQNDQQIGNSLVIIIVVIVILIIGIIGAILIFLKKRSTERRQGILQDAGPIEMQNLGDLQNNTVNRQVVQPQDVNEIYDIQADAEEPLLNEKPDQDLQNSAFNGQLVQPRDENEAVINDIQTDDDNGEQPLLNAKPDHVGDLQAVAKINVNTLEKDEGNRAMLECSMNCLVNVLKDPLSTWSKETIIQEVRKIIKKLEDSKQKDLLVDFIKTINHDKDIETKLFSCGEEMYYLISSVQERYTATKVEVNEGCVCFVFYFDHDLRLKKLLNDFFRGDKGFRNSISKILLNQAFLGIFKIQPETVTWEACELKVYKGAEEVEVKKPEKPIVGTSKDLVDKDQEHTPLKEDQPSAEFTGNIRYTTDAKKSQEHTSLKEDQPSAEFTGNIKDPTVGRKSQEHTPLKGDQPSAAEFTGNIKDTKDAKTSQGCELQTGDNQSIPLGGAAKKLPKLDGKEDTDKHVSGVLRFIKLLIAVAINLAQISRDLLEIHVPHAEVDNKIKSSNLLTPAEKDELSKAVQYGYVNIKIPLMYRLFRCLCFNIFQPTDDWDDAFVMPEAENVKVGDDIERIKVLHYILSRKNLAPSAQQSIRHEFFGRISASVTQQYFDRYWTIISEVCKRMQNCTGKKYVKSLEKIHELTFERMQEILIEKTPEKTSTKEARFMPELKEHTRVQERSARIFKESTNIRESEISSEEDLSTMAVTDCIGATNVDAYSKGQEKILEEEKTELPMFQRRGRISEYDSTVISILKDFRTFLLKNKLEEEIILDKFHSSENEYPAYKNVKIRELSFASCDDSNIKDRAWDFARDGFYYEGYGVATTCFHCGLQKDDWKEKDDIHTNHKTFNESCNFVKYVQSHIGNAN